MSDGEEFNINERDYNFALNPLNNRRKTTKNDQIYGIWNDNENSSEDDDEITYNKPSKKSKISSSSKPLNFVKGEVNQSSFKDDVETEIIENSDDSDDLRFDGDKKQIKNNFIKPKLQDKISKKSGTQLFESLDNWGGWEKYTKGFGSKILEKSGYKPGTGLGVNNRGVVTPLLVNKGSQSRNYIGSQGNTVNIKPMREEDLKEAFKTNIKSDNTGQNLYKMQNKPKTNYIFKNTEQIIAESNVDVSKISGYPPRASSGAAAYAISDEASTVKIVDMTSSEVKVYTGYQNMFKQRPEDELTSQQSRYTRQHQRDKHLPWQERHKLAHKEKGFAANGLIKNLDMILTDSTEKLVKYQHIVNNKDEVLSDLDCEIQRLQKKRTIEDHELGEINATLQFIEEYDQAMNIYDNSIDQFRRIVTQSMKVQNSYPQLIVSSVRPLLQHQLRDWNPIEHTYEDHLKFFEVLHGLLSSGDSEQYQFIYQSLVELTWYASLDKFIKDDWWPPSSADKQSLGLLSLLDVWRVCIPDILITQLISTSILHKLNFCVNQWSPRTDPVPVHSWLLPWIIEGSTRYNLSLQIFHSTLDSLRYKLDRCLSASSWHPSDDSAHAVLMPWQPVFPSSAMAELLHTHILPRLKSALRQMIVEPNSPSDNSITCALDWTVLWADLLDTDTLSQLLAQEFFPKWLQTLALWLNAVRNRQDPQQKSQEYTEVAQWFQFWLRKVPQQILQQTSINAFRQHALNMMIASKQGNLVSYPSAASTSAHLSYLQQPPPPPPSHNYATSQHTAYNPSIDNSYQNPRNILEDLAQSMACAFYPLPNKYASNGLQVYRFGDSINVCCNSAHIFLVTKNNLQKITQYELQRLVEARYS